jgi:predicted oxidoreductase
MIDSGVERQYHLTGDENEPDFNGRQQSGIIVNERKLELVTPKTDESICCKGRNFMRIMTIVKKQFRLMIVPADAVIQRKQVLFILIGCKARVCCHLYSDLTEIYIKECKESSSNRMTRV